MQDDNDLRLATEEDISFIGCIDCMLAVFDDDQLDCDWLIGLAN